MYCLTLLGFTIAFLLIFKLNENEKLGAYIVIFSSFLSAIGVGISINNNI